MAVARNALKKWEKAHAFALSLPGATEEFPWGDTVAEAHRKVLVFLGAADGTRPPGITAEPTDAIAPIRLVAGTGAPAS